MGSSLTSDRMRNLLRCAADHGEVSSEGFVRALSDTLACACVFDAVGMLLEDGRPSLSLYLAPRDPSQTLSIERAKSISWTGPGSLAARIHAAPPYRTTLSEDDPFEAALIAAGFREAAFASITSRWLASGLLFVASSEPSALSVDLDLIAETATAVATIRMLLGGVGEDAELAGLEQLDYFATMGRLAGGLVHEVNNPATFIALAAGQIEKSLAQCPGEQELQPIAALVHDISDSSRQMRSVVSDFHLLSAVARHATSGSLDFGRFARACATLTTVTYRTKARLDVQMQDLPACPASFAALGPVIVNLLVNAIQAIPSEQGELHAIELKAWVSDDRLHMTVRDTGVGIAPDLLPRVFDPFFTTRLPSQGAGLGLTLAREAVWRMRGDIRIDSGVDQGTCVEIVVPLG